MTIWVKLRQSNHTSDSNNFGVNVLLKNQSSSEIYFHVPFAVNFSKNMHLKMNLKVFSIVDACHFSTTALVTSKQNFRTRLKGIAATGTTKQALQLAISLS